MIMNKIDNFVVQMILWVNYWNGYVCELLEWLCV
jgi:hypothetical protein